MRSVRWRDWGRLRPSLGLEAEARAFSSRIVTGGWETGRLFLIGWRVAAKVGTEGALGGGGGASPWKEARCDLMGCRIIEELRFGPKDGSGKLAAPRRGIKYPGTV